MPGLWDTLRGAGAQLGSRDDAAERTGSFPARQPLRAAAAAFEGFDPLSTVRR